MASHQPRKVRRVGGCRFGESTLTVQVTTRPPCSVIWHENGGSAAVWAGRLVGRHLVQRNADDHGCRGGAERSEPGAPRRAEIDDRTFVKRLAQFPMDAVKRRFVWYVSADSTGDQARRRCHGLGLLLRGDEPARLATVKQVVDESTDTIGSVICHARTSFSSSAALRRARNCMTRALDSVTPISLAASRTE